MSTAPVLQILREQLCWREIGVAGDRSCPKLPEVVHCRNRVVFPADDVLAVRRIASADVQPPPATVANAPAAKSTAVVCLEGREVAVLDEIRLLDALARSLNP